jgi:hypothetical protein
MQAMPDTQRFRSDAEIKRIAEAMLACALPGLLWTHGAHWASALYLIARRPDVHPPANMPSFIRRYNKSLGNENTDSSGYHETITQASLRAGLDALNKAPPDQPLFETLNALLASPLGQPTWLLDYWSKERLMSVAARRTWVAPDLQPFPFAPYPRQQFASDAAVERIGEGMIACTLPGHEYTHAGHWASAVWLIARRPDLYPPGDMPTLIRRYNEARGYRNTEAEGYHDTITQASLRAARATLETAPAGEALYVTLNRLLLSPLGETDWLLTYWRRDTLMSPGARGAWVEPDLAPFPFPFFPA